MSDGLPRKTLSEDTNDSLPDGWREASLTDVADVRVSSVDKKSVFGELPVRLCNYIDVYNNEYITAALDFMDATATPSELARFSVEVGDVMITKDSETPDDIGVPAVAVWSTPRLVCGYHLALFKPDTDLVDPVFLAKQLGLPRIAEYFGRLACGSTRYGLSNSGIARTPLRLPPVKQQRKIARILTTVDKLIEKTESLIAKYQAIKQGMMHDLFIRGVDAHGHLRPPQTEAPDLYKQSELGWIPKMWEVDRLVNRITFPQGQVDPRRLPYRDWILVAPDHIEQRTGRLFGRQTATEQGAISGKYEFHAGDVVYSKIRPYLRKAILASEHGICSADMYPLRNLPALRPHYLLGIILGEHFSRFAESVSARSGFPKINRLELAEYRTSFPELDEQDRICRIIESHEKVAEQEQALLAKYKEQKTGLMQDLLTGKVRVTVEDAEEVATHG